MGSQPLSSPLGARLLPNLGAEEGSVRPGISDGALPQTVRRLWQLLFATTARELDAAVAPVWPAELGEPPQQPVFGGLENSGGLVPWLSTPDALQRAEQARLDYCAAPPLTVAHLHDKGFAQRLARNHGALPYCLQECVHILDPAELAEPTTALRSIEAHLRSWPTWALQSFVLKPRYGFNGRGRVAGGLDSLDQLETSALRGSLARLAARGGAILEPWLERRRDFCVQWFIPSTGPTRMLGSLEQVVSPAGLCRGHRGCIDSRGRVSSGRQPDEACREASAMASIAAQEAGYSGPLGVDGFSFVDPNPPRHELLRPLVEINARFSIGGIALGVVRRAFDAHKSQLELEPGVQRSFYFGLDAPRGGWKRALEAAGHGALWIPLGDKKDAHSPALLFAASVEALDRALAATAGSKLPGVDLP